MVNFKIEVVVLPVSDVDRAKEFYSRIGFREDVDYSGPGGFRVVHFTPPGSPASIIIGSGITDAAPGSAQSVHMIVDDIEAARTELVGRGIEVSEIFHALPGQAPQPGRDPHGRSYVSHAAFSDPDGNQWVLQEVTDRIPGRV